MHGNFLTRFGKPPSACLANTYSDIICINSSALEKAIVAETPAATVFPNPASDFI